MRDQTQTTPGVLKHDPTLFSETLSQALARGDSVLFRPEGVSMLPWLREGEKVRVLPVAGRDLRRGDIALFWRSPGHPILHRVVQVRREAKTLIYECLGDSESGTPESVSAEAVIGVVETTVLRRFAYLALHSARRHFNRLCLKGGIQLRHG